MLQEVQESTMSYKLHQKYFKVKRSKIQGRGAFAVRKIRKGTRIVEYIGRRIHPDDEATYYNENDMERHHTFLFGIDKKTTIDAGQGGNEARFINHSCAPNCEAAIENKRVFIYATRTIQPGEELTYDYHFEVAETITRKLIKFYPCHCKAETCRGTILLVPKKKRHLIPKAVSPNH